TTWVIRVLIPLSRGLRADVPLQERVMKKEEYRAILSRLPLKSPTPQDMAMLCPHLTAEEAVQMFGNGSGYVALPPLRVRHGFQIASYHAEWVEEVKVWRGD